MTINRRFFTGSLLAGAATTAMANPTTMKTNSDSICTDNKTIEWNCMVSWPTQLDMLYSGATKIVDNVSRMSGGKFKINLVADGELNKDIDLLESVSNGLVECGHTASDYFSERNSAMNFFTGMPFGMMADEHLAWLRYGGGMELAQKIYGAYNINYFPAGNTGPQMGGWFNKKINTTDDLKGLKIRIGGMGGQVFKTMGAIPTSVPFLQLADAIASGKIDAAEFVGPYDDAKLGLQNFAKYYYAPGWWQLGDQLDFYVNKDAYNRLPKTYQQILEVATLEANAALLSEYNYKNSVALANIRRSKGVSLEQFPESFMRQAYAIVQELHAMNAAQNPMYREVYDSWRPFAERSEYWRKYVGKSMMTF